MPFTNLFKDVPIRAILMMAVRSLHVHRIRTGLALLGIIIGVAALITILSIGAATGDRLVKQVLALGNNYIVAQSGTFAQQGKLTGVKRKKMVPIAQKDLEAIQKQIPHIEAISPVLEASKTIYNGGVAIIGYLKGGSADLFKIIERPLKQGIYFSPYQVQTASKVAVLGSKAAEDLFANENPIGKTIQIDDVAFVVIGIAEPIPSYQKTFTDPNLSVYVPYTTVWKKMIPTIENSYSYVVISAESKERSSQVVSSLKNLLRFRHDIKAGMDDDFVILDQQELLKQAQQTAQTLDIFLMSAAGVAMIVGGIGIMNIMLVAITERKREIGIRMAVGASPIMILLQFLSESLILCIIGGLMGVALGILGPYLVSYFTDFPTLIRFSSIFISLFLAVLIGLFFGLYPAYKASQLDPVEALRSY